MTVEQLKRRLNLLVQRLYELKKKGNSISQIGVKSLKQEIRKVEREIEKRT